MSQFAQQQRRGRSNSFAVIAQLSSEGASQTLANTQRSRQVPTWGNQATQRWLMAGTIQPQRRTTLSGRSDYSGSVRATSPVPMSGQLIQPQVEREEEEEEFLQPKLLEDSHPPSIQRKCDRCMHEDEAAIQTKLRVGQPGDKYEQEADRVADQVMRMSESRVQRQIGLGVEDEEETIQTKPLPSQISTPIQRQVEPEEENEEELLQSKAFSNQIPPALQRQVEQEEEENEEAVQTKLLSSKTCPTSSTDVQSGFAADITTLRSGGQKLPTTTHQFFGSRFGYNFSHVRVHHDENAARAAHTLKAQAFTMRNHVVFGRSQYSPTTTTGQKLLAHELTHVIQQGSAKRQTLAKSNSKSGVNSTEPGQKSTVAKTKTSPSHIVPTSLGEPIQRLKSDVIQRATFSLTCTKHLKETGKKRVCSPPGSAGSQGRQIHSAIQKHFKKGGKDRFTEVTAPGASPTAHTRPGGGQLMKRIAGSIDLLKVTRRGVRTVQVQIGEIKPLNLSPFGLASGVTQLLLYESAIRKAGPECVSPKAPEDKAFCGKINATGKKVTLKKNYGLSIPARRFTIELSGLPRRVLVRTCAPGLIGYRCLKGKKKKAKKDDDKDKKKKGRKGKSKVEPKSKKGAGKVRKKVTSQVAKKGGKGLLKKLIPGEVYLELGMIAVLLAAGAKPSFGGEGMSAEEALLEIAQHGLPPDVEISDELQQFFNENPELNERMRELAEGKGDPDKVAQDMIDILEQNKDVLDAESMQLLLDVLEESERPEAKQTSKKFRKVLEEVKKGKRPVPAKETVSESGEGEGQEHAKIDPKLRKDLETRKAVPLYETLLGKTGNKIDDAAVRRFLKAIEGLTPEQIEKIRQRLEQLPRASETTEEGTPTQDPLILIEPRLV